MKNILLIGGGGHCRSCVDVIETEGRYKISGFVCPLSDMLGGVFDYPYLGSDEDIPDLLKHTPNVLVTVGQIKSPSIRIRLFEFLRKIEATLPVIVSPHAYCSKNSNIKEGTIIMHGALLNAGVSVGFNCIINSQSLIEHDVFISNHCHISTGVRLNGGVRVGKSTFIGSGTIVKENISIGENVVIGSGQIILKDVPDYVVIHNAQK